MGCEGDGGQDEGRGTVRGRVKGHEVYWTTPDNVSPGYSVQLV